MGKPWVTDGRPGHNLVEDDAMCVEMSTWGEGSVGDNLSGPCFGEHYAGAIADDRPVLGSSNGETCV